MLQTLEKQGFITASNDGLWATLHTPLQVSRSASECKASAPAAALLFCSEALISAQYHPLQVSHPAHYGLTVGRRLQDPEKDKNIHTLKVRRNWHEYALPKPAYLTSDRMAKKNLPHLLDPVRGGAGPDENRSLQP
jgi:hypothetical protein